MLNDVAWRKMPTDILTNENMTYIESHMPAGLEYAPFMFYQAALKKADDDGIFDIEDGVIFARLMRVSSPAIVFQIANLMGQRKLIGRVSANSNVCFFVDWEYPSNKQQKSWKERRDAVQSRIVEAEQFQATASFDVNVPEVPFSSFECDKNAENVSQTVYCDKNQNNVSQNTLCDKNSENCHNKNSLERERERKRERETHTEKEKESLREGERELTEASASAGPINSPAPAPAKEQKALPKEKLETEKEQENQTLNTVCPKDVSELAQKALETTKVEQKRNELFEYVNSWFKDNCFGYQEKKAKKQIADIVTNILELDGDSMLLAKEILTEFKRMHDSEGVWKDIPLQPVYTLKSSVWAFILNSVGKKLKIKKKTFLDTVKTWETKAEKDQEELNSEIDAEYLKYGINPQDPNRFLLLAKQKSQEQNKELAYQGDIF